jgi:hypothetical protein
VILIKTVAAECIIWQLRDLVGELGKIPQRVIGETRAFTMFTFSADSVTW